MSQKLTDEERKKQEMEMAEAIEAKEKKEKEIDKELEKNLKAYKEANADIQNYRYKQPEVVLPKDAETRFIPDEGKKEPEPVNQKDPCEIKGVSLGCSKAKKRCTNCAKIYCTRHVNPNTGGYFGGHTCEAAKECNSTFHFKCSGHENKICPGCGLTYCNYHIKKTHELIGEGHLCSEGCSTSLIFTPNCKGEIQQCPDCKLNYCKYHSTIASSVLQPTAGHVCKEVTGGAMLFGDSFGDFFSLAGQVVITFATGGACPIAAITLLFRSMKIAALAMIKKYGLQDLKPYVMKVVEWVAGKAGLEEGQLVDKSRTGRKIMFTDEIIDPKNVELFCSGAKGAGLAIKGFKKVFTTTVPDWIETAVTTAQSIGENVKIYQTLVVKAIKASFVISEILGLIYHLEAAWAGSLGDIIKAVKSAANVIDDFNILFGFTTEEEVQKKNEAQKKNVNLTCSELHRDLEMKHSLAHHERSMKPMSDTDRHIIRYARENNHGNGDVFIETLMAFDSQMEILQNQRKDMARAHDEEMRRLTDRIRELETSYSSYPTAPGQRLLPVPERFQDRNLDEIDEPWEDMQEHLEQLQGRADKMHGILEELNDDVEQSMSYMQERRAQRKIRFRTNRRKYEEISEDQDSKRRKGGEALHWA